MRIRTIKPEFFHHSGIYDAEQETGLPLRVAYVGLWCAADREGRFKWEPRRLKIEILPYDDGVDFSRVLDALATRGFIFRYASDSREFGVIPSFRRHQVVNNKERPSELPEPSMEADSNACLTRASRVPHACHKEGKGREAERKGREPEGAWLPDGSGSDSVLIPPVTLDVAKQQAAQIGVTPEAAAMWWHDHDARGWVDSRGQQVRNWRSSLTAYGNRWRANEARRGASLPEEETHTKVPALF